MKRQYIVLSVAALAVLGAVIIYEYPRTGFWFTCGVAGLYILTELPGAIKRAVAFRHIPATAKLKLLSTVLMIGVLIGGIARGAQFGFIPMFLLLAYDYFYYEKRKL